MPRYHTLVAVAIAFVMGLWLSPRELKQSEAARPSLGALQAQVNQLSADISALQADVVYYSEFDAAIDNIVSGGTEVGVAKVAVGVGPNSGAATAATAGYLRYESSGIEYSNGSEWQRLANVEVGSFPSNTATTTGGLRFNLLTFELEVSDGTTWRALAYATP